MRRFGAALVVVFLPSVLKAAEGNNRPVTFLRYIRPLLTEKGCNAADCHGSVSGGGGLRLSLFGADPRWDYEALVRTAGGRYVDFETPVSSLLLKKATGGLGHKGKAAITPNSRSYKLALRWIRGKAPYGSPEKSAVRSLVVTPEELKLRPGESRPLSVQAKFGDGSTEDVTKAARYEPVPGEVVEIRPGGELKALSFGEGYVVVSYLRVTRLVRVVVPQELPMPYPEAKDAGGLDGHVSAKLKELGIPPSRRASDAFFLRRVYLSVIGTLPTPQQARTFLQSKDPQKRRALIEELLNRPEFADWWALKWGDLLKIKSEYPSNLWPNAVQAYSRWIRRSVAENKPLDRFARELLTASGSNFRDPPVNFYRAFPKRDPRAVGDAAALIFMGMRLGCARCHAHPLEPWGPQDELRFAAFFAKVGYKRTGEWKEEIVFFNPRVSLRDPLSGQVVKPALPGGPVLTVAPEEDPRRVFARYLTDPSNRYFARSLANRVWYWLFGHGIVDPPDDLRPSNPPSNPELLNYLAAELVKSGYDFKHLLRVILNSETYQRSSKALKWNAWDRRYFSRYLPQRLPAEVLLDAVNQVTQTSDSFWSRIPEPYTFLPRGHRAVQLADGSIGIPFLELFGRPSRDASYESERSSELSLRQVLHFLNSSHLEVKISRSPYLKRLLRSKRSNREIVEDLYLRTLSRFPSPAELDVALKHVKGKGAGRIRAFQDILWALLNSKEFLFNH